MRRVDHPLLTPSLGCQKILSSFHFGPAEAHAVKGPKFYIQASLHAEELPGMLVAHHLLALLEAAQARGAIQGEIVVVPVANPIGLAQRVDHKPMGRFDLNTSENFNRHYPDFAKELFDDLRHEWGTDPQANVDAVRRAIGGYLKNGKPTTELQSLRHTLLTLAHDADYVLDLHCDCESVMHFYTEEACWASLEPLACYLQSEAVLLAKHSGSGPFDECLSGVWWKLADACATNGINVPLPQGCCTTTIELRGEQDVSHALAAADARAIYAYLLLVGAITGEHPPAVPRLRCAPTPLAGSETLHAKAPGLVVFAAQVGQALRVGDLVAEVINPIEQQTQRIVAGVAGIFYARIRDRYVVAGAELGKIAGATAFKTGELLGA